MPDQLEATLEATLSLSTTDKIADSDESTSHELRQRLSEAEQKRVSLLQELVAAKHLPNYGQRQREVAKGSDMEVVVRLKSLPAPHCSHG